MDIVFAVESGLDFSERKVKMFKFTDIEEGGFSNS